eukprot:scaffold7302_cov72-Cyclotella_meneghiniana.AAC.6
MIMITTTPFAATAASAASSAEPIPPEEIYQYFTSHLSALLSSLPLLLIHVVTDTSNFLFTKLHHVFQFFFPNFQPNWDYSWNNLEYNSELLTHLLSNADSTIQSLLDKFNNSTSSFEADEMKRAFVQTVMQNYHQAQLALQPTTWGHWIQGKIGSVITADRTLASYLWGTCRGLILVLLITSIIPGRLHGWTGRLVS